MKVNCFASAEEEFFNIFFSNLEQDRSFKSDTPSMIVSTSSLLVYYQYLFSAECESDREYLKHNRNKLFD